MIRTFRYRIYPTAAQKAYFAKAFGCCRYAYNFYVREHERMWEEEQRTATDVELISRLRGHKSGIAWLDEADTTMLAYTARRVTGGYDLFFEHVNIHPPHEHKKGERQYQSFTTRCVHVDFRHNLIQLPLIGCVRAVLHRRFYGLVKCCTVKQEASGSYYISLFAYIGDGQLPMKPFDKDTALGIDLGVRHFATLSTGEHIDVPDVSRAQNRKAFLQRRLKQQKEDSKGYEKTRRQIARLSEHIANVRLDFHHKKAKELCDKHSAICMETLNAEQMLKGVGKKKDKKDKCFNRQLKHVAIGQFSEIMEHKAALTGTHFTRIDRWEPTTKRCHVCGYVLPEISLDTKEWTCPECHTHHDRDVNAAINIRNFAIEQTITLKNEEPLDDEQIKKQLSPGGRKVRTATATSPRTVKATAHEDCRPSTQIDDGTPRRRLAITETQHPLRQTTDANMAYLVSSSTVALLADTSAPLVDNWAKNKVYDRPKPRQFDKVQQIIKAYQQIGHELRHVTLHGSDVGDVRRFVLDLRKLIQLNKVCEEVDIHTHTFPYIYSLIGKQEFRRLMDYLHFILPMKIETECQQMQAKLDKVRQETTE